MSQLENDRQTYIDYIEQVSKICNLDFILDELPNIRNYSIKKLDSLSRDLEEIYHSHLSDIEYSKLIKEIEESGSESVLNRLKEEGVIK